MRSDRLTGLKVNDGDNVATLLGRACASCNAEIVDRQGRRMSVTLADDIPYGHKIALTDIRRGEAIIKYGEQIGVATADIRAGQHVHVHNVESTRGRGDWEEEAKSR